MADGGDGGTILSGPWSTETEIATFPQTGIVNPLDYPNEGPTPKPPSPAAQILMQAALLIDGERDRQHGDRALCLGQVAREWNTLLNVEFNPHLVALMMAKVKIARMITGAHNPDDYVDAAGYIALAGELAANV